MCERRCSGGECELSGIVHSVNAECDEMKKPGGGMLKHDNECEEVATGNGLVGDKEDLSIWD